MPSQLLTHDGVPVSQGVIRMEAAAADTTATTLTASSVYLISCWGDDVAVLLTTVAAVNVPGVYVDGSPDSGTPVFDAEPGIRLMTGTTLRRIAIRRFTAGQAVTIYATRISDPNLSST